MQFPESWLRSFCDPALATAELAEKLTMGGFEVESVAPAAPPCTDVVVGEVLTAVDHPNSDHLHVCTVAVGGAEPLTIVCGAPNVRAGMKAPCALVGAHLPAPEGEAPIHIKRAKLRGVESRGMLCSERELGISADHGGLLELAADLAPGTDIRAALHLDEPVFNIKLTPNLGHALSVYGVARELAGLTGAALQQPSFAPVAATSADTLAVRVDAPDLCGRFSGRVVRGLNTQARSPAWLVERLARCGQRSVSALVDISNYVMFEFGRPTHIFDLAKIQGGLTVRWGRAGEHVELLNGTTVEVDEHVGVICDERAIESLAGIMGGAATAVSDTTTDIFIEAAFWWPAAIAGRSRRFNFSTEAGYRFERGVDAATTVAHIERITRLILEVCGTDHTTVGPVSDQQVRMPERPPVRLRVARAAKVIGVPVTAAQCAQVFRQLGFGFTEEAGVFTVTPPSQRFDLTIEEDLIEEIARVIGYASLPTQEPLGHLIPKTRSETRTGAFAVRHTLAELGYFETINFSFVDAAWERDLHGNADPIRVLNPIASQLTVMRSSLIGSLLQALQHNVQRRADAVRLFEIGRVFRRDATVATSTSSVQGVRQALHVAGVIYGPRDRRSWDGGTQAADFFDVKGDVELLLGHAGAEFKAARHPAFHPGRCAEVIRDGQVLGTVGELHPRWRQQWDLPRAPMLFELALDAAMARPIPAAQPVPRQLAVERDIAVIVAEAVTHDALLHSVRAHAPAAVALDADLFDLYRPDADNAAASGVALGEKSAALRLFLIAADGATLDDSRIDQIVAAIVQGLTADLGARLRA